MSMGEDYYETVERETVEESQRSGRSYLDVLYDRWPTREERAPFLNWVTEKGDREQERLFAPVSHEDLRQRIDTANYNNKNERASIVNAGLRPAVPWFPIGVDSQDDYYRVVPHPWVLLPDQEPPETDRKLVSPNVLGVNINVQPRQPVHPRVANYPEKKHTVSQVR